MRCSICDGMFGGQEGWFVCPRCCENYPYLTVAIQNGEVIWNGTGWIPLPMPLRQMEAKP